MKRDYFDYIQDILDSIKDIEIFITGADFYKFKDDKKTINAIIRSLEVIGEAAKKLPDEIREKYSDIPWKNIVGMRDKLIHEYFGVDEEIIWKVASEEIPSLKLSIQKIFNELDK
ncbi:MAG: DUF86 domain-containing protein [Candidatus Brennerbacteria bacterium]|nr:DUF86 domain-containing protein [Candidatus Brennerbacteria bacterium]